MWGVRGTAPLHCESNNQIQVTTSGRFPQQRKGLCILPPFMSTLASWGSGPSLDIHVLRFHNLLLTPLGLISPNYSWAVFLCLLFFLSPVPTPHPNPSSLLSFPMWDQARSLSPIYQCIRTITQVLICVCCFFPVNSGCKGFISLPHSHYIK